MVTQFNSKISVSPDVMVRQVGNESVLLDLKTERYIGLDDVSTRMWQLLAGAESIDAAYAAILSEFDVDPEQLRTDLDDFVQELVRLNLVELQPGS